MKGALQQWGLLMTMYTGLPERGFGVDQWVSEVGDSWDRWDLSAHSLPF